mgnify:CR=1 FL=1
MKKRGILIVVSGFSGAGKGTVMRALLENMIITHYLSQQLQEIREKEK